MPLKSLSILVVDDNSVDREIAKAMLTKLNVDTIHESPDPTGAEHKIEMAFMMATPYDVVLLDWNLEFTSGAKVLKFIRGNVRHKNTNVIIMTGTSSRTVVDEAIENGVDDFIVKPLTLALLSEKLEKVTQTKRA